MVPPSQTPANMSQDYYCKPANHVNLKSTHCSVYYNQVATYTVTLDSFARLEAAQHELRSTSYCNALQLILFHIHHALKLLEQ
jgi:hypothetical protein